MKSTKKSLVASLIVLCLCFASLIGTTFAWFTDEVTSSGNIIKTGTLDVEMYWAKGAEDPAKAEWFDASAGAIFANDKWEPGYTEARHLKIENKGTLAFNYKLAIIPHGEVSELADVIEVYYSVDKGAMQINSRNDLDGLTYKGTLREFINNGIHTGTLEEDGVYSATVVFKMKETAGNEYMNLSIGSDFSIQLLATQVTSEKDSFDETYDANAFVTVDSIADLRTAIDSAVDTTTIFVQAGTYQVGSVIQIEGKSISIVGLGVVNFEMTGKDHMFRIQDCKNPASKMETTIKNINIDGKGISKHAFNVKYNVTANLENIIIKNTGWAGIILDNANPYDNKTFYNGVTTVVNLKNTHVEEVSMDTLPVVDSHVYSLENTDMNYPKAPADYKTYAYLNYDAESSVQRVEKQPQTSKDHTTMYVNGDNSDPIGTVFMVDDDAELKSVLDAIHKSYRNRNVVIKLAAGEYSGDYVINQYPDWNGIHGKGGSGNNYATGVANAPVLNIKLIGATAASYARSAVAVPAVSFTGTFTVNGFGNSDTSFDSSNKNPAPITFENVAFDGQYITPNKDGDVIVFTAYEAADNITFNNCYFANASHVVLGGSNYNNVDTITFNDCYFANGGCLSGYPKQLTVNGGTVDMADNGFLNIQNAATVIVNNVNVKAGKYFLRTGSSSKDVNVTVNGGSIELYADPEDGTDYLAYFRGSNDSLTISGTNIINDTINYKGVDANSGLSVDGKAYYVQQEAGGEAETEVPSAHDEISLTVPAGAPEGNYSVTATEPVTTEETTEDDKTVYTVSVDITLLKDGVKVTDDGKTTYTVVINVGAGEKLINKVLHNGEAVTDYIFNPATGDVTFEVSSFSPFEVVFEEVAEVESVNGDGSKENPYIISNYAELCYFRDDVNAGNTYAGKYVVLTADIDLPNTWTPIGAGDKIFMGNFDGNEHVISNLVIVGKDSNVGLFGNTHNGEIKNLVVENAKVSGDLNVAVVAGYPYTTKYTNITVQGHVEVDGFAYVGGVGGKNAYANWSNITVNVDETSYVKANSSENGKNYRTYVGGVIGFMGEGGHTVQNVTSNIDVYGNVCDVGGIVGIAHYGNNFKNIVCTGNVAGASKEIGGIAGVWHNENGTKVTLINCKFEGKIIPADSSVDVSGNTLTGGAYSSTGTGELVVYDMSEDGEYVVCDVASFATALEMGMPIILKNDLVIDETLLIPANASTVINLNGNKIVGTMHKSAGHVIKNEGTLVIKNGTVSSTAANGGSAIMNAGTLTVVNATLNGAANEGEGWPSYTVNNIGIMTIEDSIITSVHGALCSYAENAVVTLNNSTIEMSGIPGFTSHGIYTYNGGKVVVNGGTYKNNAADQNASGASVINGAVEINSGNFVGRIENYYGTPVIKGGMFNVDPAAKYLAEGYQSVDLGNGTWLVVDEATACVSSVDEFKAALKASKNIVLLKDITIAEDWDCRDYGSAADYGTYSDDVVIDGMGHSLKFTGNINDGYNNKSIFVFKAGAVVKNLTVDISEIVDSGFYHRVISAMSDLVVDNCNFIAATNITKANAIVVGCVNNANQIDASVVITNCTFTNWRRGVSDNESGREIKSVVVDGCKFVNADVYLSAYETVTFTNNEMLDGSYVNICSYTAANTAKAVITGNTLAENPADINRVTKIKAENVTAQDGISIF